MNNVGQSHSYPEYFHVAPEQEALSIMTINNIALVRVTKLVAPGMVARKRGLILNVSSTSGWAPSPLLSVYAGTKSFVHHFSASLGSELAPFGVIVSSLNTHFVVSKLSKIRRANLLTPMPRDYVRWVLGHIGQGSGGLGGMPYIVTPYPTHALLQYAVELAVPWTIVASFVRSACAKTETGLRVQTSTSASASGPCARPSARASSSEAIDGPLCKHLASPRARAAMQRRLLALALGLGLDDDAEVVGLSLDDRDGAHGVGHRGRLGHGGDGGAAIDDRARLAPGVVLAPTDELGRPASAVELAAVGVDLLRSEPP